jgi:hypothetical protein
MLAIFLHARDSPDLQVFYSEFFGVMGERGGRRWRQWRQRLTGDGDDKQVTATRDR